MDEQSIEKRERWLKRIQKARRNYSYQKWIDKPNDKKVSPKEFLLWVFDDIAYLVKWNINLLLQLRTYGSVVKKYSGLSFFQQWKRMAYLVFVVRTDSSNLRPYHLFDQKRWKDIKKFSFGRHHSILKSYMGFSCKDELFLLKNKFEFYQLSTKYGWNTPQVHGVFKNGELIFPNQNSFQLPQKDLFVKELEGGRGKGAKYFKYSESVFRDLNEEKFTDDKLISYLKESANHRSLILQDALKNHDEWKKFSNGSLVTCRIVTGRSPYKKNEIIPFIASLRIPFGKLDADNFSLGGIATQIDIKTGILGKAVVSKPIKDSFSFDFHPDTGERITGTRLFFWDELVEFTRMIHRNFKLLSVGWDVTLTEHGLCIIEGNEYWGSDVLEAPGNTLLYDTAYPEWVESWIEIFSTQNFLDY